MGSGATPVRPTRWLAPLVDHAKFNVDAGIMRSEHYGAVGAVCCDHMGISLGASTSTFKSISGPESFEALAVREALSLADDLLI
jgi:hypothetical protein